MLEIKTEKVIDASLEDIWKVLTNFSDYKNWNSFITNISGTLVENEKLIVHISPPNGKKEKFSPNLLKVKKLQEVRWAGVFISPWLFRGEHYFKLTKISEKQTLLTQGEIFTGLLVPLAAKKLNGNVKKGFENMNEDLRKKCCAI
jgi:hypothetical protein